MTEAERQQVIDALENSVPKPMDGDDDYCEGGWKRHKEALAIMRREREEPTVPHVHEWFSTGAMEPGQIRCISCGAWGRER